MTEPTFNQYAAPVAEVADVDRADEFGELKYLSATGRIGRLRYLAWLMGIGFLINVATWAVSLALLAVAPGMAFFITLLGWLPILWYSIITGIKRAHDFNASGWTSIISLIPVLGTLIFCLIPGTQGSNSYGAPPPANTWGVRVVAAILPLVCVVGILAAIAIPQYKAYTDKARAAQSLQQRR